MKRAYRQAALPLFLMGMVLLDGCATYPPSENALGPAMVVSVSSDGRHAISSHSSKHLVLWDLEKHQKEIIFRDANIYSAYFIHGRDAFLWQDLADQVYVQTVEGEVVKQFEHFPTYGHVMDSSMAHYIASDDDWNLFHGYGKDLQPLKKDGSSPSFLGTGKLMHLSLAEESNLLVSAGFSTDKDVDPSTQPAIQDDQLFSYYGGIVLWDLESKAPIDNLEGNTSKVDAVISPDGQWVVSGDESGIGRFTHTDQPEKMYRMARYTGGIFLEDSPYALEDPRKYDKSGLIPVPMAEKPNRWGGRHLTTNTTVAVAFINDSKEFLRFGTYKHWVALFEAGNPWPQKYFDLGTDPHPSTFSYLRSQSIATSPQAHVLVTGHVNDGGITVYRYDPDERTLTKEWVSE
ncbi:WD40 repeat domain-containing protein [Modicisalibacter luteus]|uniref:WD40 repeat domain-containing protein n=1 Tax=Modicisalibacter luteus TaxID=453962 RepID=A0ABV7M1U5_9GAMM|nr:hypothetical protein [Halomonas lutea]GHA93504.1 hypothetical protein GCM10007159_13930 [Halomonas lutea]